LDLAKSELLLDQFRETTTIRKWPLQAAAIMCNHCHLIVTVADDPDPQKILSDFKAYGSRKLNEQFGKPASDTWWTTNGSKRKLSDEKQIADTINPSVAKNFAKTMQLGCDRFSAAVL
jgi:REP element-mobilizing transposase RayT